MLQELLKALMLHQKYCIYVYLLQYTHNHKDKPSKFKLVH